ncbi:MAG: amidohydrolase family protein [Planctomycetales bacterium]|nr:amidohydrolase family protein [Planctomycetales bacterium]
MPQKVGCDVVSRRTLLAGAAAIALKTACVSPLSGADDAAPSYVDAHSHIWTRDVEHFPLAKGATLSDLAPPSFTAEELLAVAHEQHVDRVVLIQHHIFHGWDNSYLVDAARRFPDAFRVVGMVDNFSASPGMQMRRLAKQRVTGLRITPRIYGDKWLAGGMDEMWKTAAETRQNICCLVDPQDLAQVEAMCVRFPDTPVVIDHFARIGADGTIRDDDVAALCRLAKHKVCVKASAYYALGKKRPPYLDLAPMLRRVLDAFGVERTMWASDAPYQIDGENTYASSIELIRDRLDFLTANDRPWLLAKTANRVFFSA